MLSFMLTYDTTYYMQTVLHVYPPLYKGGELYAIVISKKATILN